MAGLYINITFWFYKILFGKKVEIFWDCLLLKWRIQKNNVKWLIRLLQVFFSRHMVDFDIFTIERLLIDL